MAILQGSWLPLEHCELEERRQSIFSADRTAWILHFEIVTFSEQHAFPGELLSKTRLVLKGRILGEEYTSYELESVEFLFQSVPSDNLLF